jgi:hypothetical protein
MLKTMEVRSLLALLVLLALSLAASFTHAQSAKTLKARELVGMHDTRAVRANGHLYLKAEWLSAARDLLKKEGKARGFGADWDAANPHWQRAERALVEELAGESARRFDALAWLKPQWSAIIERDFSEADIDLLIAHFKSDEGAQQARMLDHALANNVLGAFSLTHRLKTDVPGTEKELKRTQELFYRGEESMIFQAANSPSGIQFAFSQHGKKYTYDIVTNVTLMFVRDLQDRAAASPAALKERLPQAEPAFTAYQEARDKP